MSNEQDKPVQGETEQDLKAEIAEAKERLADVVDDMTKLDAHMSLTNRGCLTCTHNDTCGQVPPHADCEEWECMTVADYIIATDIQLVAKVEEIEALDDKATKVWEDSKAKGKEIERLKITFAYNNEIIADLKAELAEAQEKNKRERVRKGLLAAQLADANTKNAKLALDIALEELAKQGQCLSHALALLPDDAAMQFRANYDAQRRRRACQSNEKRKRLRRPS